MQSNTVDGTLSEVLQLPVTSWRLVNTLNPLRGRRQVIYCVIILTVVRLYLIINVQAFSATQDNILGNVKSDDYDETKNVLRDSESDSNDDEEEEEIIPDTRQTLIEPSPVFLPVMYDTDHFHRHHRRDESVLNIPKDIINSTPVQVKYLLI